MWISVPASELRKRAPQLLAGLVLFGVGAAMMVRAEFGLSPWEVLHQGISRRTGIPIGTSGILVGMVVLVAWLPLRERYGFGTIANTIVIGVVIDSALWFTPEVPSTPARWALLVAGDLLIGLGSGLYIGTGLGPGARDGLMTAIARRGPSIRLTRTSIEIAALGLGIILGGTVGVGTILFALSIGPLVQFFLPRFTLAALPAHAGP